MNRKLNRNQGDVEDGDEWDGFCRLCFSEANGMAQLFPENNSPDRDLLWKILECTTLKLTFDTDHTARICLECIQKMTDFCDYRMQCLRNDKRIFIRRQRKNTISHIKSHPKELNVPEVDSPEEIHVDPLDEYGDCNDDFIDDVEEDDTQQLSGNPSNVKEEITEIYIRPESKNSKGLIVMKYNHQPQLVKSKTSKAAIDHSQIEMQPEELKVLEEPEVGSPEEFPDDQLDECEDFHESDDGVEEDDIQRPCKNPSSVKEETIIEEDYLMNTVVEQDSADTEDAPDQPDKVRKKRIRKVLLHDGHTYQLLSSRPKLDSITWGCVWRKSKACRGTIGTRASGLILGNVIPQHNHPPQPVESKQRKAVIIHAYRDVENIYLFEPYEIVKNRIGADMLMYNGDRYSYSHSRKDGCRIWKCSSHRNCKVSIYLCPDGRIFKLANSQHSDDKIQQKRSRTLDNEPTVSDVSSNIEDIYPQPVGTFNYKIVKNANKRNVLIYEGDRYTYYYKKTNGWVVWRCTVSKGCLAMIYQLCDESVVVLGDMTHDHLKATDSS